MGPLIRIQITMGPSKRRQVAMGSSIRRLMIIVDINEEILLVNEETE